MFKLFYVVVILAVTVSNVFAAAVIPTTDRKGSRDNPLLKRYEGSFIVAYEHKGFAEFTLPLSRLEQVPGKRDGRNNRYHEPNNKKPLEGTYTRLVYVIPENRSPLEVLRNYQDEIRSKGGKVLFECKEIECGGDAGRSSGGGGGNMSLAMYLYPEERVVDSYGSSGHCAITQRITDQRYFAAEIPDKGAHISVLAYMLKPSTGWCGALNGRTIAVVDILEAKPREQKMVMINADEMAKAISNQGRIALYGIYFDFNKAEVKSESDPTLDQIARFLKNKSVLKLLVVGHTDNVGSFSFNMDLSQRRATSVVSALTARYGIGKDRLTPLGISFASPVESNKTEEGRAKNRRVELVENGEAL
jgi:outer membrane protein OmpA-like peptidoglycan-associated protein